jgi:hypothetical protein
MGKLIKNHWARLIILTAAIYQCAAALEGFFWPKIFWDYLTKNLDGSIVARLVLYPLSALVAVLLYQATNPAIYYCIGTGVYFWAFSEGEVRSLTLGTYLTPQEANFLAVYLRRAMDSTTG